MKKLLKVLLCVVLSVAVLAGCFIGYLTLREYRPEAVESMPVRHEPGTERGKLPAGSSLCIMSWNTGYGALGKYNDFTMEVGTLEESILPEGWSFVYDSSVPTCRLLNQPYDPADTVNTQYYVIDGYMVSPNVGVSSVQTLDEGFENTDHNPVVMNITLE